MKSTSLQSQIVLLVIIFCIILFAGSYLFFSREKDKNEYKNTTLHIGNNNFQVQIADTDTLRTLGLSYRKSLCSGCGMLFIFDHPEYYRFWMKGMNFPLDFIWINGNKIVDLTQNVPNPQDPNTTDLPTYAPQSPADKVLEVNSGVVTKEGIKIGEKISY
ncbi:DUF192 domain-containing protein [Patescibacteria group bacterium]|nr:DUF192 domain-containing protein [Patescibacteria group bacterium]MCL5797428.1 DUF192 domain-containing protein [Patescibacteria group bacterium]